MANPTRLPGDLVIGGDLRMPTDGKITPPIAKADILAVETEQAFTVPMTCWREHDGYATALLGNMKAGSGITSATGEFCEHRVTRVGHLIKTEIFIDLTGLNSSAAGDIIGDDAAANCHLGQITAAINGTIRGGRVSCLETPATGEPDIDLYSATEATGTEDAAITGLTETALMDSGGDWTATTAPKGLTANPAANEYLYLVGSGGGTDATYTAGILLIELWGTSSTDNHLELVAGTHATNAPSLQTDDFGGNGGATSYYARGEIQLPWEYVAAGTVKIRLHAGMLTTVADTACTVDLEVCSSDEDSTSSADLCTTAAQDMNSLVFADLDFTVTATSLNPGDLLDVKITVSANDSGDAGVMKGCIGSVQLLCNVR